MTIGTIPLNTGKAPMREQSVEFPWPPSCLSPNSRKDRRGTTESRRNYKMAWRAIAKHKLRGTHLDITFHPPDGRRRDLDNMFGAIKYGIDGLALAMGVDDSVFSFTIRRAEPRKPHGCVVVEVRHG